MGNKIRVSGSGDHIVVNRNSGTVTIGAVISCYCAWFLWWQRTCHHCRNAGCTCRAGWFGRRHVCHHCLGHVADLRVDDLQRQINAIRYDVSVMRRQLSGVQRQITRLFTLLNRRPAPIVQPCTQPHSVTYRVYSLRGDITWWLVLLVGVIVGVVTWLFHSQWGVPNTLDWRVGLPFVAGGAAAILVALVSGVVSFIRNR